MPDRLVRETAASLPQSVRLVALFLDAQFEAFPASWCLERFGRPYPPCSIVFGAGALERYQDVVRSGRSFANRGV